MTDTAADRALEPCVIAKAKCCGAIVYASVDKPEYWDAASKKELADLVLEGYEVSKATVEDVRTWKWGCKCKK
jgi:hypothetical protein